MIRAVSCARCSGEVQAPVNGTPPSRSAMRAGLAHAARAERAVGQAVFGILLLAVADEVEVTRHHAPATPQPASRRARRTPSRSTAPTAATDSGRATSSPASSRTSSAVTRVDAAERLVEVGELAEGELAAAEAASCGCRSPRGRGRTRRRADPARGASSSSVMPSAPSRRNSAEHQLGDIGGASWASIRRRGP